VIGRHALAGAIGLVLAGGFAVCGLVLHASPHRSRPSRPAVAGAYFRGGVPTHDPKLEHVLGEELADLVIEADGARRSGAPLHNRPVLATSSEELSEAWSALLAAIDRWARYEESEADLRARAHAVSDQLAALGLGYYLRADVLPDNGVKHAAVIAYRVEQVTFVRIAGEAHRVLELRRLDRINVKNPVLGMQSDDLGDPVVLLDEVEGFIASHVAPALAGAGYPFDDRQLALAAGGAIRRELAGRDAAEVKRLVIATVRRHEARHDYDLDLDPPLHEPPPLAGKGFRANAELSAYLSQIANDPVTPQLSLWNLAGQTFHHPGTAEAFVGAVVICGLAHTRVTTDRSRLAAIAVPLASLSDDQLRAEARALWRDLYSAEPATMVDAW
jgi:hypothetical protein